LDDLCRWAERGQAALVGDTLAHTDVRADNLLFDTDGCVRFVDWPWACVGPAWLDAVLLLLNVTLFGGHDVDALLARQAPSTDPADLTAVIGGLAGFFTDISRRPAPPGLPTVRAFQRAQAAAALGWFQQRLAGESQP
jgi:aminoglycoside phosphotransferase (APT) family kinase protein